MTSLHSQRVSSARRLPAWPAIGLSILLLAAGLTRPAGAQTASEVQVTPETMTLAVGQRQTLFAAAYDRQGNLIPSAKFTFWSSDSMVARVLRDGTVMGIAPGLAKVEARTKGRRASLAVLITGGADTAAAGTVLTLEPGSVTLLPGEGVLVAPQALLEDGTPVPAGRVTWKSLRSDLASVDSTGFVVGATPGRTVVQASTRTGLMATLPVEVQAAEFAVSDRRLVLGPEETDTLLAVVPAQGNRRVRSGLQWLSSDTTVIQVGPTGIVTARSPGEASVIAAGFGQERRVPVLVHRIPQSIIVSPGPGAGNIQLPLRATQKLTATAEAADSTPIPEAHFQWSVGDTAIVAFDVARATLVGKTLGSTTVTAHLRGFEPVVWTVDVIPGMLGLERTLVGLRMGERRTLGASLVDSSRVIGPAAGLAWSADRADIVQASGDGVLDGLAPGRAVVTAAAPWGQRASAQVIVTGDLFLSSNRAGKLGIYQLRTSRIDSFYPVLRDSASNVQPVLSPDRTQLAFSSDRNGSFDLFVMDADGRNPRRITMDGGTEGEPVWTPDGKRIVFTSNQPGAGSQLRSITPDGKDARLLTNSPGGNLSPDVSPDGRTIAFVSAREGNQELYLMDIAGGEARRITKSGPRESNPRFLPNGELLYVVERGKGSRVMRLAPGGKEPVLVLETDQPVAGLDLDRDGERIAYVVGRLADVQKGKAEFRLFLHPLSAGAATTQIPLRPGEQVVSPAF